MNKWAPLRGLAWHGISGDMSMTSPTWRALGQVVLVYFASARTRRSTFQIRTRPTRPCFIDVLIEGRRARCFSTDPEFQ